MAIQQKKVFKIPRGLSPSARESIANTIIKLIRSNTTKKSVDANNSKFAKYSKKYSTLKHKRKVNLTDTGSMLKELKLLTHRSGSITIGYGKGDIINGKVEGNRKGTYGRSKPIPGKARDFLGLTDKALSSILSRYTVDKKLAKQEQSLYKQAKALTYNQVAKLERQAFLKQLGLSNV